VAPSIHPLRVLVVDRSRKSPGGTRYSGPRQGTSAPPCSEQPPALPGLLAPLVLTPTLTTCVCVCVCVLQKVCFWRQSRRIRPVRTSVPPSPLLAHQGWRYPSKASKASEAQLHLDCCNHSPPWCRSPLQCHSPPQFDKPHPKPETTPFSLAGGHLGLPCTIYVCARPPYAACGAQLALTRPPRALA
jgi:hypothetical protein